MTGTFSLVGGAQHVADIGDLAEFVDAGAGLHREYPEAFAHEDAVLVQQRHDVRDGAQRDQIQHIVYSV